MKFMIIGCGSMGKRRIGNLQYLGIQDIIAFDVREDRRKESEEKYHVETVDTLEDGMKRDPDVLIISVPPSFHIEFVRIAVRYKKHFFCEYPFSLNVKETNEAIDLTKGFNKVVAPSCNMWFHPHVQLIKQMVNEGRIGKVVSVVYDFGAHLPSWHPWEDYRSFYVSDKQMGGGSDLYWQEFQWMKWVLKKMLGDVKLVSAFNRNVSNLELKVPDLQTVLFEFESKAVATLHFDMIQKPYDRYGKLIGEKGIIIWTQKNVRLYTEKENIWQIFSEPEGYSHEETYIKEIGHLLNCLQGKETFMNTLLDEKEMALILKAMEESSSKGIHVRLN